MKPAPGQEAPRFTVEGRVRLGKAPEVLAVGPEGVGATGTVANALYAAEAALRERWPRMLSALRHVGSGDQRRLVFALHPAGGPIELSLGPRGRARLSACTALAGPGYHRFLGEVAAELGEAMRADWTVPRPDERLERQFMHWLRHTAEQALAAWLSGDAVQPPWLQPLSPGVGHWQGRGAVATVVGPRPEAWLQAIAADPTAGLDAFPWWNEGRDVDYLVGRARTVLWRDVRWRAPTTPEEMASLSEVSNLLAEAWELDPDLDDAPWAAWHDVLTLLGEAEERRARVRLRMQPGPPEGYRRHLVRERLPGDWQITLPGSMGVSWSEEEGWCAWEARRTAWFSALRGEERPALPVEGEVVEELQDDDRRARLLRTVDEEGEETHLLSGWARARDQLGLVTLAWQEDPTGKAWAEAAWRSLARGDARGG